MGLTYFKRYRMEIDLTGRELPPARLPEGYHWIEWAPEYRDIHAETKYLSFRTEIDANVFPCLGALDGCLRLMTEISRKTGFLPEATWLIGCRFHASDPFEYCGTIQGIRDRGGLGAIQNLGVVPEHRGRGLGTALLVKALHGFRQVGLRRALLEATAQNEAAIRLYERLGFTKVRTVYKAVEVAYS